MTYICPLCRSELVQDGKQWRCGQNHSFDQAKEGYVNLLPVQKKNSRDPGDNKQMMQARRAFLNAGYYQALSDRVNELAQEYGKGQPEILDLGCGEGYYSERLQQAVGGELYGLDISRTAIRYAAKAHPQMRFCVASAYDMPFADAAFELMLRIYAPSKDKELARVCRPGGIFICVSPGPRHHFQLKEIIYSEPREHEQTKSELPGFGLLHDERLQWPLVLPAGQVCNDFLEMTPYAWKLSAEQKQQLQAEGLRCELDFYIQVYRRNT
ncbi:MAG: 23S rRNA (guanine(745)-N(1))-methyltransferase [Shewanella algae]